ncbi:MAG TPA: biopolymer transporter ExbD, partial [Gammaproteobacteria bacterium]|nr:biopolymer transporter ExbD [Gammaproteobacteria bacterium]
SLLQTALQSTDTRDKNTDGKPARREATIMGDKVIPYRIVKKVMASCTAAGFERISLAVLQKPPGES